jgi:hypothetical protein
MIFSGKAGGFMAEFAKLIDEIRGIEYAPTKFEIADDLSHWGAQIHEADAMGFKWKRKGKSSKHIPFDWNGP